MVGKILGIVNIIVDGTTLLAGEDCTLEPGGVNRSAVKGSQVWGYREEVVESKLEVNVAIDATFSADFFRNITASTVNFEADTGQLWVINGAWCSEPPPIGQKDGKAKVTFMGPPADEVAV